jgi:hypothetical protein
VDFYEFKTPPPTYVPHLSPVSVTLKISLLSILRQQARAEFVKNLYIEEEEKFNNH